MKFTTQLMVSFLLSALPVVGWFVISFPLQHPSAYLVIAFEICDLAVLVSRNCGVAKTGYC